MELFGSVFLLVFILFLLPFIVVNSMYDSIVNDQQMRGIKNGNGKGFHFGMILLLSWVWVIIVFLGEYIDRNR